MLGVAALVVVLGVAIADVGMYLASRLQAAAAADAAALAAAPVTFAPFGARGAPAQEAARLAAVNGTRLVRCRCPVDRSWNPRVVEVSVARTVTLLGLPSVDVTAVSRAEFVPAALLAPGG